MPYSRTRSRASGTCVPKPELGNESESERCFRRQPPDIRIGGDTAPARLGLSILVVLAAVFAVGEESARAAEPRRDRHGDVLPDGASARLGTVRYRGAGQEFLADGRTLLGCAGLRLLWLDATTGQVTRSLDFDHGFAWLLAVSQDRATAAVRTYEYLRGADGVDVETQIRLIDTSSGKERSRLRLPSSVESSATCAAFTPNGGRLVMGGGDGVLRIWNTSSGREESARAMPAADEVQRDFNSRVESVAFSPDGKWLVAASTREAVRWQWQTDQPMQQLGPTFGRLPRPTATFAPVGGIVAIAGGQAIRLFDVESGRQVRELSMAQGMLLKNAGRVAFTADGKRLVAPMYSPGGLDVWNIESGELEIRLPLTVMGQRRSAAAAAVSPNDRWVVATDAGYPAGAIAVWDLQTGRRVDEQRIAHLKTMNSLTVSPEGKHVLTAGIEGLAIVWEAESGRPVHVWPKAPDGAPRHSTAFLEGAFSPDGRWIAVATWEDVILRERESGDVVQTMPGHGHGEHRVLQFTPDGARLLSFGDDWFLQAFDTATGKTIHKHALRPKGVPLNEQPDGSVAPKAVQFGGLVGVEPSRLMGAEFAGDGRTLVLLTRSKVHLFDVDTGKERTQYEVGRDSRRLLEALNEDDSEEDEEADGESIWDDEAAWLNRHATVSSDGRQLATLGIRAADADGFRKYVLQIRRLEDGKVTAKLSLPDGWESALLHSLNSSKPAFSPDGSKIALVSHTIDVYDIAQGRLLAQIPHSGGSRLAFTPDGERIVVAHDDTTVLVWEWKRFLVADD